MLCLILILCFFGQYFLGKLCQQIAEREQHKCCRHIEQRMHIGNLRRRIAGRPGLHEGRQRRGHANPREKHRTDDIEKQMNQRRAFRVAVGTRRCKQSRHASTDVLPEQHINRTRQSDNTADRECL